ncbi:hypothetical protein CCH79_00012038 [Gambusia affinis]|uniref:Receptor-binding cancer antigen expressed on SiSo cells n=1 Tax=Gambusia affinis TaxID=33528 RepID=A0A315W9A5_GAMAF|nr:hypothetical protein CCH79_00012038 [Gambusia affinis]
MAMLFPNCFKYDIYSRFQLRKSDQHPGIAFVMTVFPQWHIGKHSGIKIYEPGEVVLVQQGIPFLLQLRQLRFIMAITQFRLFKICTCLASLLSFFKRLICRSGRGRKLSGDQITLPTTPEIEEWSSWDEEAPTSIKIEGGNGNVSPPPNDADEEPDYFKDMAPTIRKTQKILLKKREPLNYLVPDGSAGFSSRLAASQDMMSFSPPSAELGEMENWQEDTNAWEDESDAAWEAEEVLREQKMAEREKRFMEQQKKKMEKEAQRMLKKEQKIAVKLS